MVLASDRLKQTGFKGMTPIVKASNDRRSTSIDEKPSDDILDQPQAAVLKRKPRRVRPNKNHLKFPIYADDEIGFVADNPAVSAANLITTDTDEDYETDGEILRRTINVCKKDVMFALNKIRAHPSSYQLTLINNKYQKNYL